MIAGDSTTTITASTVHWIIKPLPHLRQAVFFRLRLQVQLLGWLPDIASLMASSRLVILPSHYEGMPNVILEAMAAGKPVVCSRVEGSQELLRHDWEHQTFPTGDSQQMATLASRFLGEAPVAKATGTVNQTFIHDHYTMASMVQRYRNHYQKLLGDQ